MKKTYIIRAIVIALLCVITQWGGISHAGPSGIVGSKHDLSYFYAVPEFGDLGRTLSTNPFRFETLQSCVFCHTPHGANPDFNSNSYWDQSGGSGSWVDGTGAPTMLWNRGIGNIAAEPLYSVQVYTSPTMDSRSGATGDIWTYSLMCLSCHDGVSAMNVLQNNPNDPNVTEGLPIDPDGSNEAYFGSIPSLSQNIGGRYDPNDTSLAARTMHLENDHPVSINYETAVAGGGLWPNTGAYVTDTRVRLFPDNNGNPVAVECSTCHDVHNEGSTNPGSPLEVRFKYPFLVVSNAGSNLCTRCHNK